MKRLFVLQSIESDGLNSFIDFWSKLYELSDKSLDEKLYNPFISKPQFDEYDIQKLFEWKNGMELSPLKQKSVDNKIKSKLERINFYKSDNNWVLENFLEEFQNVSAVWKIFLLHITKPKRYAIYDQHVHRAYNFIHELEYKTISADSVKDVDKLAFYRDTYLKFINKHNELNLKKMDEALVSFGQFLKNNKLRIVFE